MDKKKYILSQYANSPKLMTVLNGLEKMIGVDADIKKFYDNIFNIQTANTYGLNVWGERLNISRRLKINGQAVDLEDKYYRFLLLVKAMANISNCTVPNLEVILNYLFQERGNVYVFDTGIMTMKYSFDFYLDEMEKAILNLPGIPPKPTGVGLTIVELPKKQLFGFNKTGFKPFNQAPLRRN